MGRKCYFCNMKKLPYLIPILSFILAVACTGTKPEPVEEPQNQNETPAPEPEPEPKEPVPVVIEEPVLVTSEIMMKFITEITYDERDYSYTHVMDEPYKAYGAPGDEDLPPTLEVSWEVDQEAGPLTLTLSEGDWSSRTALSAGTQSAKLSNLVPGRSYEYVVTRDDNGAVVGLGSFKTIGLIHQVYFQTRVRNARDLGGWSTVDGKKVKFRKLYRGGKIDGGSLSSTGKKEMLAEGILAELDLREKDDAPSSSPLGKDIAFYNPDIDKGYGGMIRDRKEKVIKSFQFATKCVQENKPLYFHCSIGRDRTGTMAALFLGLLGVSESDISKEYELLYFSPADWSLNGGATEFTYSRTKQYGHRYTCNTLWELGGKALGVADNDYTVTFAQRIEAYLLSGGVTQAEIDAFRAGMLE